MKPDFTREGFLARRAQYCNALTAAAKTWYNADGSWKADSLPAANRERLWGCCAIYETGDNAFADAIVLAGDTEEYHGVKFNIFDTNISAALLANYRDRMSAAARAKLERLVRDGFCFRPGNRQPDYQFHGYNDNMPAKATMGLILGGDLLGEPDAAEYGLWSLRQMRAMLVRCGINSEYNSPTYSPLTIHAMGEIAHHAKSEEARQLAKEIEQRLWIDLAARYHCEMGKMSGPNSRAYTADTVGHLSCGAALLWFVLGDAAKPSPMQLFEPGCDLVLHHMDDVPFNTVQMAWYATGSFHLPLEAQRLFTAKPYPFRAVATAEHGDGGPDFPARTVRIETVQHPDFTLGTANAPFCGGEQTMSYFVTYKRRAEVETYRDSATVFNKFVVDDEVPGEIASPSPTASNRGEADHCHSFCHSLVLQDDATALVVTHPHLALGGKADTGDGPKTVSRLSELVIFPGHHGQIDEILVGGKPRAWEGSVAHGEWIVARTGRLLIGIRPIHFARGLAAPAVTLERHDNYQFIRTTLYQGEPRTFTRQELRYLGAGFVAEHASVDDYPSLQAFADKLAAGQFTDYYWTTRRTRYRREGLEMETSWSAGSPNTRIAAINGKAVQMTPVAIDTLDTTALPFLAEPFKSVPSYFPWEDFRVEWGDWPYAIGDREV